MRSKSKKMFAVALIALPIIVVGLFYKQRREVAYFEGVEVKSVRILDGVTLADLCLKVEDNCMPPDSLKIDYAPGIGDRRVETFYCSDGDAIWTLWSVARAFNCKVTFGENGKVYIHE